MLKYAIACGFCSMNLFKLPRNWRSFNLCNTKYPPKISSTLPRKVSIKANLNLKNVRAAVIQKAGVVRNHNSGHILQRVDVRLYPRHINNIQMICRLGKYSKSLHFSTLANKTNKNLIEQKNICSLQHGPGQCQLHAPTTRKRRNYTNVM